MARRLALVAHIIRGRNEALAEVVHPDTIHLDARRKRVSGRKDRLSELEAPTALSKRLAIGAGEYLQELARHDRTPLVALAAQVDIGVARLRRVRHDHRATRRAGVRQSQF